MIKDSSYPLSKKLKTKYVAIVKNMVDLDKDY